jgi:hypothetical protein
MTSVKEASRPPSRFQRVWTNAPLSDMGAVESYSGNGGRLASFTEIEASW